jgi:hypothetical protein
MKKTLLLFIAIIIVTQVQAQTSIFNELLQKHLTIEGFVDYKNFKADEAILVSYISYLE